ncbi:hypothetical protein [Actinacidiphila alni]|uniref:hypothetical protein n=1 Tax=Actinacidiphila alni TaxID=380248 RepID=UPI0034557FA9
MTDEPIVLPADPTDPDAPVPYTVAPESGWNRPDVETAAIEHLTTVVGPVSARQIVDGLIARGQSENTAAKDTRTAGASTLSSDVLGLLTAIRDALTVPRPARGGDAVEYLERRRQREQLIADRATGVRIAAAVGADTPLHHLADTLGALTQTILDNTAAWPVEYEVRPEAAPAGGEQA